MWLWVVASSIERSVRPPERAHDDALVLYAAWPAAAATAEGRRDGMLGLPFLGEAAFCGWCDPQRSTPLSRA